MPALTLKALAMPLSHSSVGEPRAVVVRCGGWRWVADTHACTAVRVTHGIMRPTRPAPALARGDVVASCGLCMVTTGLWAPRRHHSFACRCLASVFHWSACPAAALSRCPQHDMVGKAGGTGCCVQLLYQAVVDSSELGGEKGWDVEHAHSG